MEKKKNIKIEVNKESINELDIRYQLFHNNTNESPLCHRANSIPAKIIQMKRNEHTDQSK